MVLCSCSFMPLPTIPKACLQHLVHGLSLWLLSLALSLCALLHSSAICLYLPSWCICLSLSEVWETGVRGLCQTNQQHSLTAIPLCIWLCIWMCTVLSASTTTDRVSQDVHTHTHTHTELSPQRGDMWCTTSSINQREVNKHAAWSCDDEKTLMQLRDLDWHMWWWGIWQNKFRLVS